MVLVPQITKAVALDIIAAVMQTGKPLAKILESRANEGLPTANKVAFLNYISKTEGLWDKYTVAVEMNAFIQKQELLYKTINQESMSQGEQRAFDAKVALFRYIFPEETKSRVAAQNVTIPSYEDD